MFKFDVCDKRLLCTLYFTIVVFAISLVGEGAPVRLTDDPANSLTPDVAMGPDGSSHIVWSESSKIYYMRLKPGGQILHDKRLVFGTSSASMPRIAVDSYNNAHIVFQTVNFAALGYVKMGNSGLKICENWPSIPRWDDATIQYLWPSISIDPLTDRPVVAVDIHILRPYRPPPAYPYSEEWITAMKLDANGNISVRKNLWSRDYILDYSDISTFPSVAVDNNGRVHVVWLYTSADSQIAYSDWIGDEDEHFRIISNFPVTWMSRPSITSDPHWFVHVVWPDSAGKAMYAMINCAGAGDPVVFEPTCISPLTVAGSPDIAAGENGLHAVWTVNQDGNQDIYYAYSGDFGSTWDTPIRITTNSSQSFNPTVAAGQRNCPRVVWQDNEFGNYEILMEQWQTLSVHNPGDGRQLRLEWDDNWQRGYEIYRRQLGDGQFILLTNRWMNNKFEDKTVDRGQVYEYQIKKRGAAWQSNVATGKAEQVIVLVSGLNLLGKWDRSGYWSLLQSVLEGQTCTVWNACWDPSVSPALFLTGTHHFQDEAAMLREYIDIKKIDYRSGWEPPKKVDFVAHSMGALTSRKFIYDLGDNGFVRRLVTLSGAHCGSNLGLVLRTIKNIYPLIIIPFPPSLPATDSCTPAYLETHWYSRLVTPKRTPIFMAAGTTPSPNVPLEYISVFLKYPNDGVVDRESSFGRDYHWYRWKDLISFFDEIQFVKGAEEIEFPLNHYRITDGEAVHDWVKEKVLSRTGRVFTGSDVTTSTEARYARRKMLQDETAQSRDQWVFTTNGIVTPPSINSHAFPVDSCDQMCVWSAATNPLCLYLKRPNGTWIDPNTPTVDSNVTYLTGVTGIVGYCVNMPMTGLWETYVALSNGTTDAAAYALNAMVHNTMGIQVFAAPHWSLLGDAIMLGCRFGEVTSWVASAAAQVILMDDTNEIRRFTLYDDGQHEDAQAGDGLYAYVWTNVADVGVYSLLFNASGMRTDGCAFARVALPDLSVSMRKASFTGIWTNECENPDGDGRYKYLRASFEIVAETAGCFAVAAELRTTNSTLVQSVVSPSKQMTAGQTCVFDARFDGSLIRTEGANGPFLIGPCYALDVSNEMERVGLSGIFTTAVYSADMFAGNDTDADGLPDDVEDELHTDSDLQDTDGDGISDYDEVTRDGISTNYTPGVDTNPNSADTDGDGFDDAWEIWSGLSPVSSNSPSIDSDGDGLNDGLEYQLGTSAGSEDTDGDGLPDGWEYKYGLDSLTDSSQEDPDGDRMLNWMEYWSRTDPTNSSKFLHFTAIQGALVSTCSVVKWTSETGVVYRLKRSTNLVTDPFMTIVHTNISATPPINVSTDEMAGGKAVLYYRIGVER